MRSLRRSCARRWPEGSCPLRDLPEPAHEGREAPGSPQWRGRRPCPERGHRIGSRGVQGQSVIELVGFMRGWQGLIEKRYLDLGRIAIDGSIGGTVLKSSRVRLDKTPGNVEAALHHLRDLRIDGLIVIGGDDTLSNSLLLAEFPQVLIAKTIDNDIGIMGEGPGPVRRENIVNWFTLGFPTAARRICAFVSLREGREVDRLFP